jgi:hypothetical protein
MDLGGVDKKIREAEFFLDQMREFEKRMLPAREKFDFFLSALLSAGRAVDGTLRQEETWRKRWDSANGPAAELLGFFADDQKVVVRDTDSKRGDKENLALAKTQHQEGGATATVAGPPGSFALASAGRDFFFEIDGVEHKVTDACAEYLKVLKKMVEQFKADHR